MNCVLRLGSKISGISRAWVARDDCQVLCDVRVDESAAASGAGEVFELSTGSAMLRAASRHPSLQPLARFGAKKGRGWAKVI